MNINLGLSGFLHVKIGKSEHDIRQEYQFNNMITNTGLDSLSDDSPVTLTQYCRVGQSSAAPEESQADLVARWGDASAAGPSGSSTNSGGSPWWHAYTRKYQFKAGSVSGAPLGEIGFFDSNQEDAPMFSRALFKDSDGNPITINVLEDEILFIEYTLRMFPPENDFTGTLTIDGVVHTVVARALAVGGSGWSLNGDLSRTYSQQVYFRESDELVSIDANGPVLNPSTKVNVSYAAYSAGSYSRSVSASLGLNQANFATGIGGLAILSSSGAWRFQVKITPKIMKDNKSVLTLNSFFTLKWGRHSGG
ncbi:hypothetical protein [Marinagarivorans algicola]|uniref:hypothetical protein n=1 Tax=Marinagarivorans algicola TaxID=1513270 RepID=UPI0037365FF0